MNSVIKLNFIKDRQREMLERKKKISKYSRVLCIAAIK